MVSLYNYVIIYKKYNSFCAGAKQKPLRRKPNMNFAMKRDKIHEITHLE
jgi:hypothetical protein